MLNDGGLKNDYKDWIEAMQEQNIIEDVQELSHLYKATFDMAGRLLMTNTLSNSSNSFAVPFNHADGMYIFKIKFDNGSVATQKLISQ